MSEPYDTAQERITTVEDGPDSVNERLSPGGPGPEGQEDTAHEILSGQPADDTAPEVVEDAPAEPVQEPEAPAEPVEADPQPEG